MKLPVLRRVRKPRLPEECVCRCHRGAPILHVVDCCKPCPHCGRRIATAFYNAHVERCGVQND